MPRAIRHLLLASALAVLAPAARAQAVDDPLAAAVRPRAAAATAAPFPPLASIDRGAAGRRAASVARTEVDRTIGRGGLIGSLGFLCGLQPTPEVRGGAQALGVDDQGRFLGAKLRLAFH